LVYQESLLVVEIKSITALANNVVAYIDIPGFLVEIFVFVVILHAAVITEISGNIIFNVRLAV